jgi:hypothetical protein
VESNWVHSAPRPLIGLLCQSPCYYDDGEIGGMIGRGNRSPRRKPAPVPLCPPQTPTCCPDAKPGHRCAKPTANRLSYGTAWAHEPSSPAQTLGSWDRIPLEAWISVCVRLFCVCVVLCIGSCFATGWFPVQWVLPTAYRLRNWKSGQGPQGAQNHR